MGFLSGLTGGVTLTLGVAYLTVFAHERTRRAQAENLRMQSRMLDSLLEPTHFTPPRSRTQLARKERSTLVETAKDLWNDELESAVRRVQSTDWNSVSGAMEGSLARFWGPGLEKSTEVIEERGKETGPMVQNTINKSKDTARVAKDQVKELSAATAAEVKHAEASTHEHATIKVREIRDAPRARASMDVINIQTNARSSGAIRHGGTINAARGGIRDAFSKGIEIGKEAAGKVQAAVGLATERMESRAQSSTLSHSSAVEKAFHERFEYTADPVSKNVEEALEERYKPIDERDNTLLRGL